MDKPFILDPCCGSKMFYHDKESDAVMFCDIRELHTKLCDGRELHIQPDKIIDVTNMENIADEAFSYIIFDPPNLVKVGESSWLAQKYGQLPVLWEEWMTKAFAECFRVLKPGGMLLFKWSDEDIPHKNVLRCELPFLLRLALTVTRKLNIPKLKKLTKGGVANDSRTSEMVG